MGNVSLINGHAEKINLTHYDRIRLLSIEDMASEFVYFFSEQGKVQYVGLRGIYRDTITEVIKDNLFYLKSNV